MITKHCMFCPMSCMWIYSRLYILFTGRIIKVLDIRFITWYKYNATRFLHMLDGRVKHAEKPVYMSKLVILTFLLHLINLCAES